MSCKIKRRLGQDVALVRLTTPGTKSRSQAAQHFSQEILRLSQSIDPPATLIIAGGETLKAQCLAVDAGALRVFGRPGARCAQICDTGRDLGGRRCDIENQARSTVRPVAQSAPRKRPHLGKHVMPKRHLAITMGDPAGIGPEIILKACARLRERLESSDLKLLIIGSGRALQQAEQQAWHERQYPSRRR